MEGRLSSLGNCRETQKHVFRLRFSSCGIFINISFKKVTIDFIEFWDFHSSFCRDGKTSGTQTSDRGCIDEAIQATEMQSVGTETENVSLGPANYDENSLISFLRRVAPLVNEELETEVDFSEIDQDGAEDESSHVRLNVFEPPQNTVQVGTQIFSLDF